MATEQAPEITAEFAKRRAAKLNEMFAEIFQTDISKQPSVAAAQVRLAKDYISINLIDLFAWMGEHPSQLVLRACGVVQRLAAGIDQSDDLADQVNKSGLAFGALAAAWGMVAENMGQKT